VRYGNHRWSFLAFRLTGDTAGNYQFFAARGDRQYLLDGIDHYRKAVSHWEAIVKLTDGVYYDHMVFNRPPEQVGHWKDEIPLLQAELARLEEIDRVFVRSSANPASAEDWKIPTPLYKMTMRWKDDKGVIVRWADTTPVPDASGTPSRYSIEDPRSAVKSLFTHLRYEKILHVPVRELAVNAPLSVHASILGKREGLQVRLYYRYSGKGFHFAAVDMTEHQPNIYSTTIPATNTAGTIYYYIQAVDQTNYFDGSAKEPHAVIVRANDAPKPVITHADIGRAPVGKDIHIRVKVQTPQKLAVLRLSYRHLDQSEDWNVVDMKNCGGAEYEASIPGEFVVPNWDITYQIEAVDVSGSGAIYPDFGTRDPFVVTRIE